MTVSPESPEHNDDQFNQVISGWNTPGGYQPPQAQAAASPYGTNPHIPAHSIPVKPGLTRRGKTALAIGGTLLATGTLLGWQHYSAAQAANEVAAKKLDIEQQKIDLEKQKALDKADTQAKKNQKAADQARQKNIDTCVQDNKGLVGKQLGQTLAGVISDCQAQYPDSNTTGADLQEAANTTSTGSGSSSAGTGLVIGGVVLVGGFVLVISRASRPQPQAQPVQYVYPTYPTN